MEVILQWFPILLLVFPGLLGLKPEESALSLLFMPQALYSPFYKRSQPTVVRNIGLWVEEMNNEVNEELGKVVYIQCSQQQRH